MCQTQERDVLAKYFAAVGMQVETEDDKYDAMYDTYLHESVQDKWDRITKDCYLIARDNVIHQYGYPHLIIAMDEHGLGEEICIKIATVYYKYICHELTEKESRAKLALIKGKFFEEEKRKAADKEWYLNNGL